MGTLGSSPGASPRKGRVAGPLGGGRGNQQKAYSSSEGRTWSSRNSSFLNFWISFFFFFKGVGGRGERSPIFRKKAVILSPIKSPYKFPWFSGAQRPLEAPAFPGASRTPHLPPHPPPTPREELLRPLEMTWTLTPFALTVFVLNKASVLIGRVTGLIWC